MEKLFAETAALIEEFKREQSANAFLKKTLKSFQDTESSPSPDPTLTPEEYKKEYRQKHGLPPDTPVAKYPKKADPRTVAVAKKHAR